MEKDLGIVSLAERKVFHSMTFCVSALLIQGVMSECDDDTKANTLLSQVTVCDKNVLET